MPREVAYTTKLVDVTRVVLDGELKWDGSIFDDNGGWVVGSDNVEEWLEKFKGRRVTLTIQNFDRDESHLLPVSEGGAK